MKMEGERGKEESGGKGRCGGREIFFTCLQRCPLETVILKAKKLDLGEPKKILSYALQPPNLADIERAILTLKEV